MDANGPDRDVTPVAYGSVEAAARAAGISRSALYNEIRAGRIVGRKYGRKVVFERAEIERFVKSLPTTSGH
jgi:excisionase family DNA binding protein